MTYEQIEKELSDIPGLNIKVLEQDLDEELLSLILIFKLKIKENEYSFSKVFNKSREFDFYNHQSISEVKSTYKKILVLEEIFKDPIFPEFYNKWRRWNDFQIKANDMSDKEKSQYVSKYISNSWDLDQAIRSFKKAFNRYKYEGVEGYKRLLEDSGLA